MQVTHVGDNVTHAVISNNRAKDFGISNSAEFFNILSNTLYSDKILAVVREVLCNAWDIHIQTGRTDTPVQVTLGEGKLTIRDFGTGISDDDMHPTYAIYGNSTKKLDGHQTGGFGLGSKAPFAVVDHFEVESYFEGKKTIYAISKSSAEVAGKPSIMPIVTVPTTETGLKVSLAVQPKDMIRFASVIRMITMYGEMNVELNGEPLKTIPFSQAPHGFVMVKHMAEIPGANDYTTGIFIRYGNVVYPAPIHEKIITKYTDVKDFLLRVGGGNNNSEHWKVILQAEPNTISVTPSRESLSMTDMTAEAINGLLDKFLSFSKNHKIQDHCLTITAEAIAEVWTKGRPCDLLTSDNKLPILYDANVSYIHHQKSSLKEPSFVNDLEGISRAIMARSYPAKYVKGFRKKDILMRLKSLEDNLYGGKMNRGKIQSFKREYELKGDERNPAWFQRVMVQPLMRKLEAEPELSAKKLMIYGDHREMIERPGGNNRYLQGNNLVEANRLSPRDMENYLPFLRNIVVISYSRLDLRDRLPYFPIWKEKFGEVEDYFVYMTPRTDAKVQAARAFFEKLGMQVIDLTKRADHEPEIIQAPKTAKAKTAVKPRKKGLPKLGAIMNDGGLKPKLILENEDFPRLETPQFIVQINPRADNWSMMHGLNWTNQHKVVKLWGEMGGVATNTNQFMRYTEGLNIPALKPWLLAKLKEEALTNPRLQLAFEFREEKHNSKLFENKNNFCTSTVLKLMLNIPEACLQYDVPNQLTKNDILVLDLIEEAILSDSYYSPYKNNPEAKEIQDHIKSIKPSKVVTELAETISNSKLVGLLDWSQITEVFGEEPTDLQKKQKAGALDILLYVLS